LFLLAQVANAFQVRRFDGATFEAGVPLPEGTGEFAQAHFASDPAGQLHVVWPRIDVQGVRLDYATSDNGTKWQHRIVVRDEGFGGVRVALAADHKGLAVWETHASSPLAKVHVLPLGPAF